jgi:hypothetical protein
MLIVVSPTGKIADHFIIARISKLSINLCQCVSLEIKLTRRSGGRGLVFSFFRKAPRDFFLCNLLLAAVSGSK